METLDKETIRMVVEAASDPDVALEILRQAALVEGRHPFPQNGDKKEDNAPTIPDDPDLSTIRYPSMLRRSLSGRKPDPLVLAAMKALMLKWGYPMLAKVIAKVARKMKFPLRTQDTEAILKKYGAVIVPFMAILLVDVLRKYQQLSQEQDTRVDIKS